MVFICFVVGFCVCGYLWGILGLFLSGAGIWRDGFRVLFEGRSDILFCIVGSWVRVRVLVLAFRFYFSVSVFVRRVARGFGGFRGRG